MWIGRFDLWMGYLCWCLVGYSVAEQNWVSCLIVSLALLRRWAIRPDRPMSRPVSPELDDSILVNDDGRPYRTPGYYLSRVLRSGIKEER